MDLAVILNRRDSETNLKLGKFTYLLAKQVGELPKPTKEIIFTYLYKELSEFGKDGQTVNDLIDLCSVSEFLGGMFSQVTTFENLKDNKFKFPTDSGNESFNSRKQSFIGLRLIGFFVLLGARGWKWRVLAAPLAVWVYLSSALSLFVCYYKAAGIGVGPSATSLSAKEHRPLIQKVQRFFLVSKALKLKGSFWAARVSRSCDVFVSDFFGGDEEAFLLYGDEK